MRKIFFFLAAGIFFFRFFPAGFSAENLLFGGEKFDLSTGKIILDRDNKFSNPTLQFGGTLNESLFWDSAQNFFTFTDDVNFDGNEIVDFRVENLSAAPACDGSSMGRIFFNLSDAKSYVCNGSMWRQIDRAGDSTPDNFFTVDDDNSGGDTGFYFGGNLSKVLKYDATNSTFLFNDDLKISGNLEVLGTISGFGGTATLANGQSMTVTHPAQSDYFWQATAFREMTGSAGTDSSLDFDAADETNFSEENIAKTDFSAGKLKLTPIAAGSGTFIDDFLNAGDETFDPQKIQISGGAARLFDPMSAWYDPSWTLRKKITVDHTKVLGAVSDFPVFVDLSTLGSDFFQNVKTDGGDIRITTADGKTELSREIVFVDSVAETGELHFKAPNLSPTVDTDFYIYYGNSAANDYLPTDPFGRNAVWSNGFEMVSHLNNTTDATGKGNDLTANGGISPGNTISRVGKATTFDGVDDFFEIQNPTQAYQDIFKGTGDFTISVRFILGSSITFIFLSSYLDASNYTRYYALRFSGTLIFFIFNTDANGAVNNVAVNTGNATSGSHSVTVTYDASAGKMFLYVDQYFVKTGSMNTNNFPSSQNQFFIGKFLSNYFEGIYDEVSLATRLFSHEEISTKWENENDAATFYSVAAAENVPSFSGFATDLPSVVFSTGFSSPENIVDWTSFSVVYGAQNAGAAKFQLSNDGINYFWFSGGAWIAANSAADSNTESEIAANISNFPTTGNALFVKTFFPSDGVTQVEVDSISVGYDFREYENNSYFVATAAGSQINSSSWDSISAATFAENVPTGTSLKYLFSFDGRATWKFWDGSAWQTAVDTNAGGSLADATAFQNANSSAEISALSSANWAANGGFSPGTLDVAIDLGTTDVSFSPELDQISFDYFSGNFWRIISDNSSFPIDFLSETETKITNNSGATATVKLFLR